jgi:phasin family protein
MNEHFEKYFVPVKELNTLAVNNIEKLFDLQLKYVEDSAKASIESLKSAVSISDAEGFKDYVNTQVQTSKQFAERAIKDSKTALELGNSYANEFQKVVKESFAVAQTAE